MAMAHSTAAPAPFLNGVRGHLARPKPQPEVEDDASATDLHKEKKVRVRVSQLGLRFIPVQPEPDAGEDEAHPKESHRHTDQQGWQAAEEGRTGIRTHIVTMRTRGERRDLI